MASMYLTIGTRRPTTFRLSSMRPFIYRDPSEGCVSKITADVRSETSAENALGLGDDGARQTGGHPRSVRIAGRRSFVVNI
jgi:hypothetical protein